MLATFWRVGGINWACLDSPGEGFLLLDEGIEFVRAVYFDVDYPGGGEGGSEVGARGVDCGVCILGHSDGLKKERCVCGRGE